MQFLLDTDIVSQTTKPSPHPKVSAWLASVNSIETAISAITLLELQEGIDLLPSGKRKRGLELWLSTTMVAGYGDRILPVTPQIAIYAGHLVASAKSSGHTATPEDALLAATAYIHSLPLVTLNRKHLERLGTKMVTL